MLRNGTWQCEWGVTHVVVKAIALIDFNTTDQINLGLLDEKPISGVSPKCKRNKLAK